MENLDEKVKIYLKKILLLDLGLSEILKSSHKKILYDNY